MSDAIAIIAMLVVLFWGAFSSYRSGSSKQRQKQLEKTLKVVQKAQKSSERTARMSDADRIERMRKRSE